ncbi:MAG: hypothetical protein HY293_12920, partial [Planctomycetes bacterium]|nr:hypothetical protein [Planctomycetota bacterium]
VPSVFIQPDLTHSTTYYWRVYGSNGSGAIWLAGGSPFQFTTISPVFGTPAQFFLQAPLGVTVNRIPGPTFLWTYSTGAVAYRLQIDTSSSFPAPVVDLQNLHLNQATSPVTLAASTTFYWRVTAQNSWGQTVSTPLYGSFTTGP